MLPLLWLQGLIKDQWNYRDFWFPFGKIHPPESYSAHTSLSPVLSMTTGVFTALNPVPQVNMFGVLLFLEYFINLDFKVCSSKNNVLGCFPGNKFKLCRDLVILRYFRHQSQINPDRYVRKFVLQFQQFLRTSLASRKREFTLYKMFLSLWLNQSNLVGSWSRSDNCAVARIDPPFDKPERIASKWFIRHCSPLQEPALRAEVWMTSLLKPGSHHFSNRCIWAGALCWNPPSVGCSILFAL